MKWIHSSQNMKHNGKNEKHVQIIRQREMKSKMTSSRRTITTNCGKGKRGKKTFVIAGASVNLSITYRNLYEDSSQKQKIESSNDSGNHSLVYTQMTQHATS